MVSHGGDHGDGLLRYEVWVFLSKGENFTILGGNLMINNCC